MADCLEVDRLEMNCDAICTRNTSYRFTAVQDTMIYLHVISYISWKLQLCNEKRELFVCLRKYVSRNLLHQKFPNAIFAGFFFSNGKKIYFIEGRL